MNKKDIVETLKSVLPSSEYAIKIKKRNSKTLGKAYYIEVLNPEYRAIRNFLITMKMLDRIDTKILRRIFAKGMEIYEKSSPSMIVGMRR